MSNIETATQILKILAQAQVKNIIICAGARNAPFVYLLEKVSGVKVWNFFEERSAAFFALGLAQSSQSPVVVITTSGTAVAELLPAAIEAALTKTPLIFLTADRPSSYRGSGAPQAIEQVGLFANYVEKCLDIEIKNSSGNADQSIEIYFQSLHAEIMFWAKNKFSLRPLHVNVCMDEPLIDGVIESLDFTKESSANFLLSELLDSDLIQDKILINKNNENFKTHFIENKIVLEKPLILAGALTCEEARSLVPSLLHLQAPIYAEAISNLRQFSELDSLFVQKNKSTDEQNTQRFSADIEFDLEGDVADKLSQLLSTKSCQSVVRIGGVPTLRLWRDLEAKYVNVPVCSFTRTGYSGLSRPSATFSLSDFFDFCELLIPGESSSENNKQTGVQEVIVRKEIIAQEKNVLQPAYSGQSRNSNDVVVGEVHSSKKKFSQLLAQFPQSEISLFAQLSSHLSRQHLYLGNSLPIREWDMIAASGDISPSVVTANRGANGIDGQISSFLGLSEGFVTSENIEHWGIFGDLTTMYDLTGPWALKQMQSCKIRIVVINNHGGMIFKNMFGKELFLNSHQQHFQKWAEMWDFSYYRWSAIPQESEVRSLPEHCVIEIVPDNKQSEQFWQGLKQ